MPAPDPMHMPRGMKTIWAISDGAAGNRRQAWALAQAMGGQLRELVLAPRAPWSWFAPRVLPGGRLALDPSARDVLSPPWPDLAVGCGRQAALATRLIARLSERRTRTVQILDPRIATRHWDAVVAPRHDGLAGANVLAPLGSLHPIDDDWLQDARSAWAVFSRMPSPRIGVLLGGSRPGVRLDGRWLAALVGTLRRLLADGGSAMIMASRRTPDGLSNACADALAAYPQLLWRGVQDGANPYPGVLAWADRLLASPDSVNMLSEAAATGAPVHTIALSPLPRRLARFHATLAEGGWLVEPGAPLVAAAPLRETPAVAAALRSRLNWDSERGTA